MVFPLAPLAEQSGHAREADAVALGKLLSGSAAGLERRDQVLYLLGGQTAGDLPPSTRSVRNGLDALHADPMGMGLLELLNHRVEVVKEVGTVQVGP